MTRVLAAGQTHASIVAPNTLSCTMPRHPSISLGLTTVVFTLLSWASVPLFLRHFAHDIDLWTSNGWRYGFSAVVWLPTLAWVMWMRRMPPGLWRAAAVPSAINATGQVCFAWAHYRIEPGLLTFGLRSQLVFVAVGAYMMFPRERAVIRSPGYLVGAAVLIAGMVGVLATDPQQAAAPADAIVLATGLVLDTSSSARLAGIALAVLSGLLFAGYGLAVRKYMHGISPVIAFAAICQYTAGALVLLMLAFGERAGAAALDLPAMQVFLLLLSAFLGIAVGHAFYYTSIAQLGVAVTAGVLQLQPFFVAVASMILFGEVLSGWQWSSGMMAVAGALLMLAVQWRAGRSLHSQPDDARAIPPADDVSQSAH